MTNTNGFEFWDYAVFITYAILILGLYTIPEFVEKWFSTNL